MAAFVTAMQSLVLLAALLAECIFAQTALPTGRPPIITDIAALIEGSGCPGTTQVLTCFTSSECRGVGLTSVSSAAECCGGSGLSYCDPSGCRDCFSEEAYSSSGTVYHLGFFNNLRFRSRLSLSNLRLQITSDDTISAEVLVTYSGNLDEQPIIVEAGETVSVLVTFDTGGEIGIGDRDRAVVVQSINGARINVAGISEEITSADTFCILPTVFQPAAYEYYAVSVPRQRIPFFSDGERVLVIPDEKSAFMIVTTADSTLVTLTLTQSVSTEEAVDLSQFGPVIDSGETISLLLDRDQTLYISSVDDLTGSRVVTDKPITFLSGHECGSIPNNQAFCDQMVEQIPPTVTWGFEFYTAPFLNRTGGDTMILIPSEDDTNVEVVCSGEINNFFEFSSLSAGEPVNFTMSSFDFCRLVSDRPILLAQFALGSGTDGNEDADPFMVLVPPLRQYRDVLNFRVFETFTGLDEIHFINVFLPAQFNRSGFLLNGETFPEEVWSPVPCDVEGGRVCAYVLREEITTESQVASHVDPEARLAVIVYSLAFRVGRGLSAGMMQLPIALDEVSFSQSVYSVLESSEEVTVQLTRSGRRLQTLSLLVQSRALSNGNSALVDEDFMNVFETVTFAPGQTVANLTVRLSPNDVFTEADEIFELYLGPGEGVYINPIAAANVVILNDDPDLPVMTVSIGDVSPFVVEGEGVLLVTLVKSEGAVGRVAVRLFTQNITATANADYLPIDTIVIFEINEIEKMEQILILDDFFLEDDESFSVSIEPINNLDEGFFPVVTTDDSVIITIFDNDVVVIGYDPVPCRTNEARGGLEVVVTVLSGSLAREVAVQFETFSGSATAGEDFAQLSQELVFSRRDNSFNVFIPINNDQVLEEIENFFVLLSLTGQDIESVNVVLVQPEAEVFIVDNDNVTIAFDLTPQVPEGGVARATLTTRGGLLGSEVRVRLSTIDGNATGGTDFERLMNFEVVLSIETPSDSVDIQVFDNDIFKGNKIFSVVAELDTVGEIRIDPSVTSTTIIDDEEPPLVECYLSSGACSQRSDPFTLSSMRDCCVLLQAESFSFPGDETGLCHACIIIGFNMSGFDLVERNASYSLRVGVLTGFLPQSISLDLVAIPGTASPDDFTIPSSISLLDSPIDPEFTNVPITVPREPVNTDSDFEVFRIDVVDSFGTAPSNMFFRGTVITIIDYEPVVEFSPTLYRVSEGESVTVNVVFSPPADDSLAIEIRLVSDTAIVGTDVELLTNTPFFPILPGFIATGLGGSPAEALDDDLFEGEEQFFVEIVSVSGGVAGAASIATVIIEDDDRLQIGFRPDSRFDGSSYRVFEEEGSVEVTVAVTAGELATDVVVEVTTRDAGAQEFVDYVSISENLTFNAAQLEQNVTLVLIDDQLLDNFEFFEITLSLVTDISGVILNPDFLFVLIEDTDLPPLGFRDLTVSLSEVSEVGSVVVETSAPSLPNPVQVELAFINGTAEVGRDVRLMDPTTVTLGGEVRSRSVFFSIIADDLYEADEEFFTVSIVSVTGGEVDPERDTVTVTIRDETSIQIIGFVGDVGEDEGPAFLDLFSGSVIDVPVTVLVTVNSSSSFFSATPGQDFVPITDAPVILGPRQSEFEPFPIIIIDDDRVEMIPEIVQVFLTSNMPRINFERQPLIFGIFDDDSARIAFSQSVYVVSENASQVEVTLSVVSGVLGTNFTVGVFTRELAGAGSGAVGVAIEGIDYQGVSRAIFTLNSEITEVSFNIPIIPDELVEGNETFSVTVSGFSDFDINVTLPGPSLIVIVDDDEPFQIGFLTNNVIVREFDEVQQFLRVGVVSGTLTEPVTIQLEYIDQTANADQDLLRQDGSVFLLPLEIEVDDVFIEASMDGLYEEDEETLIVRIVSVTAGGIDPESQEATVTILDSDRLTISVDQFTVPESSVEPSPLTITIRGAFNTVPLVLNVSSVAPAEEGVRLATPNVDYVPFIQFFFVDEGQSSLISPLSLTVLNDQLTEGTEAIITEVTVVNRSRIDIEVGPFEILDDDSTRIGFNQTSYTGIEDRVALVTVQILNGTLADGIVYTLEFFTRSFEDLPTAAEAGFDYTPETRLLVFFQEQVVSIPIELRLDDSQEPTEQFEAVIAIPSESSNPNILLELDPSVATINIIDTPAQ